MMKLPSLLTFLCLFAVGPAGFAQQQAKAGHHLSMQVDNVASGGSEKMGKGSPLGPVSSASSTVLSSSSASSSLSHSSSPRYRVQVSNFGALPEEAKVEWYVFAKDASTHAKTTTPYQRDKGSETLSVGAKKSATVFFQPKPMVTTTSKSFSTATQKSKFTGNTTTSTNASSTVTGEKMAGWIVRLKVGDELVSVKASSPTLEEIGKSGQGLN